MHNKLILYVISHTHWDREWYQTFQGFRKRLVFMMDELIEHMEQDPDYRFFHMDGQTIMLEDYLEIRPEQEERLKKLIQAGRIVIGPWYVMPDEFLLTGESLVRNLQKGFEICKAYGVEPMKSGYVTDIFGHNSQFPQILKGFDIDSAVLYRGIGDYLKDSFKWEGADGSHVLCVKLDRDRSYSNFYFAIRWPFEGREFDREELVQRMKELLAYGSGLGVSEHRLMMDGVDHIEIEPRLPEILEILQEALPEVEIRHSTLEEYIAAQKNSGAELEVLQGELYNPGERGVNNQVMKNVLSSMVHIKQMNNHCETLLTRWAEPFEAAAGLIRSTGAKGFLNEAWHTLLQNHPHDSICGCSITRVHQDNEFRFNQVMDLAEEVLGIGLEGLAEAVDTSVGGRDHSLILFNAGQQNFCGVMEAELEFPAGSQGNFRIFDAAGEEVPYQMIQARKGITKRVVRFRNLIDFPKVDTYTVKLEARIPAVGYSVYGYEQYRTEYPAKGDYSYREFHAPVRYPGTMQVGSSIWENEFLRVTVCENGTLEVIHKGTGKVYKDLPLYEDCGDMGDGWNYRKPLQDARYVSLGAKADISVESDGPMAVKWKLVHRLQLPEDQDASGLARSTSTREFVIITWIEMTRGSSRLNFKTQVNNNVRCHRLRALFPSWLNTETFYSSTPFFLQERPIQKPDFHSHVETDTGVFPNQGVVALQDGKDCMALYNKGLYEVEVTEDKSRTIALTLFRSFPFEVGRDEGEMSYLLRDLSFEYAVKFAGSETPPGQLMAEGEQWRAGFRQLCTVPHSGPLPQENSFLQLKLPGAVLSSFRSAADGMKVIRLYNCTLQETQGEITLFRKPVRACLLDLKEEVQQELKLDDCSIPLALKPAQVMSIGVYFG